MTPEIQNRIESLVEFAVHTVETQAPTFKTLMADAKAAGLSGDEFMSAMEAAFATREPRVEALMREIEDYVGTM